MTRSFRNTLGFAAAAGAAVGLVGLGAGTAAGTPHVHAAKAKTPSLKVTISKHLKLTGPRSFQAGRVKLSLKAVGNEREVEVVSFKHGYTFKDLRADLLAFGESEGQNGPTKAGLKHLNHAVNHTHLYGGLDTVPGTPEKAVITLPKAGTYYLYNDSGELPAEAHKLTVTGHQAHRAKPKSSATVKATSAKRFAGATTLPAHGTITFKNVSTNSPHFLDLLHVKQGTTRKQVIDYLNSGSQAAPPFALNGQAGTDVVGEGQSQTLSYKLPKGEYIELCFFPDLQTGMPHALMGMVRVVHLK
ncbi:MAG TPA: hypothetical protein VHW92_09225 [Mycobacteriales bacterium]|jgi:hypothetical protein|nr:hypothetical protein [Mycobacteriales bacterium]